LLEQVAENLQVHGWPGTNSHTRRMFILRRNGGTGDQPFVLWFFDQGIEKKLRGALHHRMCARQKILIAGEFVVGPQMRAQPRAASGPEPPQWSINGRGLAPEIGVVMTNPPARAVLNPRRTSTVLNQLTDQ